MDAQDVKYNLLNFVQGTFGLVFLALCGSTSNCLHILLSQAEFEANTSFLQEKQSSNGIGLSF
jgi:hypothetical protein